MTDSAKENLALLEKTACEMNLSVRLKDFCLEDFCKEFILYEIKRNTCDIIAKHCL